MQISWADGDPESTTWIFDDHGNCVYLSHAEMAELKEKLRD